ncbi:aspartate-alanine antiporter [Herbaspirillum chlorophenolicum]|uniref:aspartate-alanine antiporter n=1 Tax=Herbaspirillum chlorophenolicum TaxID=211589 RepID=UPI00067BFD44|nr:aspartate-alanine antiporter [Herbaspirillum chlorophenolicum]
MTNSVVALLTAIPEVVLFAALAIGYGLGKIKFGPIQLGGVCGTLIAALILGQLGVTLDPHVKSVFFALFIFALGFAGGPQFFANLNAKGLRLGAFCLIEVVVVLCMVLAATYALQLDPGTAAGLMAGAATESAIVGTATDAISKLPLPIAQVTQLQANIVTAYSITYIFGLITIVIATSQVFPRLLRINIRTEAKKLWSEMGGESDEGESAVVAAPHLVGRIYRIGGQGSLAPGKTIADLGIQLGKRISIVRMSRQGNDIAIHPTLRLEPDDEVLVVGRRDALIKIAPLLGEELANISELNTGLQTQNIVVRNKALQGRTLHELASDLPPNLHIAMIRRGEQSLPLLPDVELQLNDVIRLCAVAATYKSAFSEIIPQIGKPLPENRRSNIGVLGFGILLGIFIGGLSVRIGDTPFSAGTGGGALLTGLVLGWYGAKRPDLPTINKDALILLKDIGLTVFIACVGLEAGPQALHLLSQYGITLPLIGVAVALVPALVSLLVGHFLFKLSAPILLGAIAGQQCSTPALSGIQNAAGNSTPLLGYTITYAISNVVLPLLGPLVVALAGVVGQMARN